MVESEARNTRELLSNLSTDLKELNKTMLSLKSSMDTRMGAFLGAKWVGNGIWILIGMSANWLRGQIHFGS